MKRIIILSNVVGEMKDLGKADLFGIQTENTTIISSLLEKLGLVRVGIFDPNKESSDLPQLRDKALLSLREGSVACSYIGKSGEVKNITPQVIDYATDFNKRNQGIIDASVLQKRRVTIIGLGSGGSGIAIDLVRSGATNLNLIDFDEVSVSNICRSVYDLCDVGTKKTEALSQKLLKINPCVNTDLFTEDVLEMEHEKLMKIIKESDLIIDASDSVKTKLLINGLAFHTTPVIYPSAYEFAKGGDILFTIPGITPCYECVFKSLIPQMKEVRRGDWDYSTGQAKPMPGLIADIKVIASRAAKIALAILLSDHEGSLFEKVITAGSSILFIGNEKFWIFEESFQEHWAETEVNPECSCQTLR